MVVISGDGEAKTLLTPSSRTRNNAVILDEVKKTGPTSYGSAKQVSFLDTKEIPNAIGNPVDSIHSVSSNSSMYSLSLIDASNIWTSVRRTAAAMDYNLVPSYTNNNMKLVLDPNLDDDEQGCLYYSTKTMYNMEIAPYYALTVNPNIYQRVLKEVNDAQSIPCQLYFCCHGGDGAHTGVSHTDTVDIRVAYVITAALFLAMIVIDLVTPSGVVTDDDFFE